MDVIKMIEQLREERDNLDVVIAHLQSISQRRTSVPSPKTASRTGKRRGRKSMSPEERSVVAERMKVYWAQKRAAETKAKGAGGSS